MRRGITLLEILVVFSIMVIMMAILGAVLGRAKEAGKVSSCTSNLHQLAIAASMYRESADGKIPPNLFVDTRPLDPFVKAQSVWKCPSDPYRPAANRQTSNRIGKPVSYFSPVTIIDDFVAKLEAKDSNFGVFVCLVHGDSHPLAGTLTDPYVDYSGLVLTARIDGSVSKRRPADRCFSDQSKGRLWWDFFTDEPPPEPIVSELTNGAQIINCGG